MKNFLLIFLLSIGLTSFSQYNYQIVITGGNGKTILNDIFDEYETFNRYVNDTIRFDSHSLIDSTYISNKCVSLNYTLEYFNKDKTLLANNYQTKACCNLLLELYDSWGDGWNGATLEVIIDGFSTNYAFTTGSAKTVTITYCDGQNFEIVYNSGDWDGENSYTISNNHGIIFGDGPYPTSGLVFTSTEACSPPPSTPQDCEGATMVCSNDNFSGNSNGYGIDEINGSNSGCLSWEHQSSWYYVNVGISGTLEMAISPVNGTDDYDWAIWGPFDAVTAAANCSPITTPIRCSYAAGGGNTGMGNGATDLSEDAFGNKWVAPLNVQAGEIYILLIDNYSISNNPFDLEWDGTAGLACVEVELPVELTSFTGENKKTVNQLTWETATETNNDYFSIAHSSDGFSWQEIDKVSGAGNSTEVKTYSLEHRNFPSAINYYRLTQVDFDGKREVFPIISIDNLKNRKLIKRVNTLGQEVDQNFKGIVIEYYDDHTVEKRVY